MSGTASSRLIHIGSGCETAVANPAHAAHFHCSPNTPAGGAFQEIARAILVAERKIDVIPTLSQRRKTG